jgi:HEAT repeat protein
LRFSAAEALGNIGDKSALGVLLETAKDKQDPEVRWSAIKSLGLIGDESTIPKLTEALKDEKVLKAATNAINAINNRLMRSAQGSQNPPS